MHDKSSDVFTQGFPEKKGRGCALCKVRQLDPSGVSGQVCGSIQPVFFTKEMYTSSTPTVDLPRKRATPTKIEGLTGHIETQQAQT